MVSLSPALFLLSPLYTSSLRPTPNNLLLLQTWAFTSHITTPLPSMAFKGPFDQPLTPKPPLPLVPASDLMLDFLMSAMFFCTSILSWLCILHSFTTHRLERSERHWSCLTLCNPMVYTVYGILQARILEWVAFPFSRGSSQPRGRTQVSYVVGQFFTSRATREAQVYWGG